MYVAPLFLIVSQFRARSFLSMMKRYEASFDGVVRSVVHNITSIIAMKAIPVGEVSGY